MTVSNPSHVQSNALQTTTYTVKFSATEAKKEAAKWRLLSNPPRVRLLSFLGDYSGLLFVKEMNLKVLSDMSLSCMYYNLRVMEQEGLVSNKTKVGNCTYYTITDYGRTMLSFLQKPN